MASTTLRAKSPVTYPLRTFLDLSTAHLTKKTRDWLQSLDWKNEGPCGGPTDYGWLIYAHEDDMVWIERGMFRFPDDLRACMVKANEMGADYILFDCDASSADHLPDLPTYEEDDATDYVTAALSSD